MDENKVEGAEEIKNTEAEAVPAPSAEAVPESEIKVFWNGIEVKEKGREEEVNGEKHYHCTMVDGSSFLVPASTFGE